MSIGLIQPALVAVAFGTVAGIISWPLRPKAAMRLLAGIAAASAATVFVVLWAGVIGLIARAPLVVSFIEWCPVVPLHHEVGYIEAAVASVATLLVMIRLNRVLRRRRAAMTDTQGRRISILDTDEPIAYAAPGDPGCVVVSRGMLDVLEPRERQVLFAHERAHLTQKHHRYLLLGQLAVAVLPLLKPLADQLSLATERSADEAAAEAVAGDRGLVARTIAKAAINHSSYHHGLVGALGGSSVPARVNALIGPSPNRIIVAAASTAAAMAGVLAVTAGSVQVHHLVEVIGHLCHV